MDEQITKKPLPAKGVARIARAALYSFNGLKSCFQNEEAFRQEVVLFILLLPVLLYLPISPLFKLLVLLVNSLVLIVELLNSAIEAIVDKASPEYSHLARQAKDMASGAVFLSLVMAVVTWTAALYSALG